MKSKAGHLNFTRLCLAAGLFNASAFAAESADRSLSPQQELATFHFAGPNLTAELVAAEPDVVAPVALAWDADGRLFVAETTDYPSGPVSGRIRMLEDRDGDGRYERAVVFADKIAFPNGLMPWNGGVLVTAAPDILFFKDTDGDGCADVRRVILTGFSPGNQQLRANGLYWGLDNWIYGANGRSDGEVHWSDDPTNKTVSIRRRDFRFRLETGEGQRAAVREKSGPPAVEPGILPGGKSSQIRQVAGVFPEPLRNGTFFPGGKMPPSTAARMAAATPTRQSSRRFEAIAGHSQFGTARDDWGNRFPVFNNIPIRHVVIEQSYLDRVPLLAGTETVVPISAPDDKGRVYYLTPPTLLIPQASDYFTSACGSTIYRGDALDAGYKGNFFVCEPVHNLVQRRRLVPAGATFVAERTEAGKDFLASSDPWFHPVFTATGPDGCLYVVDFYRKYVEHPAWVADELKDTTPWRTGEEHGRIWRIRPNNWKPTTPIPKLSGAKSRDLVKYLEHENGWWRDTAQRLLVERQDRAVTPALEKAAHKSRSPRGRVHALYTLDGLDALKPDLVAAVLRDPDSHVRQHAVRLSEQFIRGGASVLSSPESNSRLDGVSLRRIAGLQDALFDLVEERDARVRIQLALTLGEIEGDKKIQALVRLTELGLQDRWQAVAILTSVGSRPWRFWEILEFRDGLREPTDANVQFCDRLAAMAAAGITKEDWPRAISRLIDSEQPLFVRLALFDGLTEAAKKDRALQQALAQPWLTGDGQKRSLDDLRAEAKTAAASSGTPVPVRALALRIVGKSDPGLGRRTLVDLLQPSHPDAVQSAAIAALTQSNDPTTASEALAKWSNYSRSTRHQLLGSAPRSSALAAALLDGLEKATIQLAEVDPSTRQALEKSSNAELKERAQRLFRGAASADREQVMRSFLPAVKLTGDRAKGAVIFAKTCLQCHAMQGEGNRVGPDLTGIAVQSRETMLMNILDPSRQTLPDFVSYTAVTTEGESMTGLITAESVSSVTLRRPNLPDATIQRSRIKELKADGKSLMPDGLEAGLTVQDMADLLSFLRQPEAASLPKEK